MIGSLDSEAILFSKYLIRETPTKEVISLYKKVIANTAIEPDKIDQKLLVFIKKHPRALSLVDAGLINYRPQSEVRRRLYVMLAILESMPTYSQKFLPQKHRLKDVILVFYAGCRSLVKAVLGFLVVRIIS